MSGYIVSTNFNDLAKLFDVSIENSVIQRGLDQSGLYLAGQVKRRMSDHVVTGRTRNDIGYKVGHDEVRVGSNSPALVFLEVGTKAHEIRPRKKKALAWPGSSVKKSAAGLGRGAQGTLKKRGGGAKWDGFINAKVVHHPGTKAYMILHDTLDEEKDNVARIFTDLLRKSLPGN